jgi:predicted secreted hydrolase
MLSQKKGTIATTPAINLPADQFAHTGAPAEWWWHIGTLIAADGRKFGFEINATGKVEFAFTQIEITDVQNKINYQKVLPVIPCPPDWAQYDDSKPWYVQLGGPAGGNGAITMNAIDKDPLNMAVNATFIDDATNTSCALSLKLHQKGAPLLVWGTGCMEVNPGGTSPITRNNYYYSLTHLHASGTITIGNEVIAVTGLTWMDHEYGYFPTGSTGPVIWLLQDIQLTDGLHLSNYTIFGVLPKENVPMESHATLLLKNGDSVYVKSVTTPMGPTYTSVKGIVYYLKFRVEIDDPALNATFIVDSLFPDQLFKDSTADVYEGVGKCHARYGNSNLIVTGTAWIEQNLG